ncbi:hypothetical protein ACFQ88_29350 [Paenibacillus sp. NPDC056579]|uniref:hypothetical protein n=1 Tax=Paenibacillus sp. NPDC056579 TaxID=3345871 RepID=UPI0036A4CDD3
MSKEARPAVQAAEYAPLAVLTLEHAALIQSIGQPAVLRPGDALPALRVRAAAAISVTVELVLAPAERIIARLPEIAVAEGEDRLLPLEGTVREHGLYEIRVQLDAAGRAPAYDSFMFAVMSEESLAPDQSRLAYMNESGDLSYVPDFKGNRIADFSNCGYMGGGVRLPEAPVRLDIAPSPEEGDDTERIQRAIDEVAALPIGHDGLRGALLLKRGTYRIAGTLFIRDSGVVLRGEGQGEDGTVLLATGATKRDLLQVTGGGAPRPLQETATPITDLYVPVGARTFHVADAGCYSIGDTVSVIRHGNASWISAIDMDTITPRPNAGGTKQWGPFDLAFDRVVTCVEGNRVTVDAPLVNSVEHRWGGGTLVKYEAPDRIEQVGIENLRVDSEFNPDIKDSQVDGKGGFTEPYYADETHAVNFVVLNYVQNAWVRDVTGYHLEHSLVTIDRYAKWVTVQDCTVRDMVSIITGGRRYSFHVTGQLNLVQRCDTETARHAFVFDSHVCGPNVFLDSESRIDFNASEPHHRWSVGGLYDNVKAVIYIRDRGWMGSGHGWAGANYVAWNTEGELTLQQPPTAQNVSVGHVGPQTPPFLPNKHDMRPRQDGFWDRYGQHVKPRSLYLQQLAERLGEQALRQIADPQQY